jgi:hypothetical protein
MKVIIEIPDKYIDIAYLTIAAADKAADKAADMEKETKEIADIARNTKEPIFVNIDDAVEDSKNLFDLYLSLMMLVFYTIKCNIDDNKK